MEGQTKRVKEIQEWTDDRRDRWRDEEEWRDMDKETKG